MLLYTKTIFYKSHLMKCHVTLRLCWSRVWTYRSFVLHSQFICSIWKGSSSRVELKLQGWILFKNERDAGNTASVIHCHGILTDSVMNCVRIIFLHCICITCIARMLETCTKPNCFAPHFETLVYQQGLWEIFLVSNITTSSVISC